MPLNDAGDARTRTVGPLSGASRIAKKPVGWGSLQGLSPVLLIPASNLLWPCGWPEWPSSASLPASDRGQHWHRRRSCSEAKPGCPTSSHGLWSVCSCARLPPGPSRRCIRVRLSAPCKSCILEGHQNARMARLRSTSYISRQISDRRYLHRTILVRQSPTSGEQRRGVTHDNDVYA